MMDFIKSQSGILIRIKAIVAIEINEAEQFIVLHIHGVSNPFKFCETKEKHEFERYFSMIKLELLLK